MHSGIIFRTCAEVSRLNIHECKFVLYFERLSEISMVVI